MFVCEITLSLFPNLLKKVWNDSVPNSGKKTESFGGVSGDSRQKRKPAQRVYNKADVNPDTA